MDSAKATVAKALRARALQPFLLLAFVFLVWELAVVLFSIPSYLIPSPVAVTEQIVKQWPMLSRESLVTTYATVAGFALSAIVGIPLAVAIVYSRTIESVLYPILVFSQSVPKIAVAPLFVVWFGFGVLPKIVVAFLLGFFPVVVSTVQGLKSVEPEMIDLARSMKGSALKIFLKVRFPYALPSIFAGLKVAITLAVVGAIVGEFVGSNSGIGYVLQVANGAFDLPLMFAALVLLSFIGVILFAILELIERIAIPWHASQRHDFVATA